MRRSDSTLLAGSLAVFLAASASTGCCKRYAKAEVDPCPGMTEAMLLEIGVSDTLAAAYIADEIIPYCEGIKAVNE